MHTPVEEPWHQLLGITFLRTYWTFQAVVAGPLSASLAISAFVRLIEAHGPVYDFVTHMCTAFLAAGIVFVVLVQRKIAQEKTPKSLTFRFELAKSGLATALWVWSMVDAALGPQAPFGYNDRSTRIKTSAIAVVILPMLFYPTVFYAARDRKRSAVLERLDNQTASLEVFERTPLLRG